MAKKALLTVNGTYHKIKKGFITQNATYHKIKKAFVTINGIYRPCWGSGEISYYGPISGGLTGTVNEPAAASIGDYAVFAGVNSGTSGVGYNTDVNAFNSSLTRTKAASCTTGYFHNFAGASNETYAIFEGGQYSSSSWCYNANLTQKSVGHGYSIRGFPGCGFNGYAWFYGGYYYSSAVRGYNSSLTQKTLSASYASCDAGMCVVGNYMLIGGGENGSSTVNAFNKSFTRSTPTALPFSKRRLQGASVGNYGLLAGGSDDNYGNNSITTVATYNTSLTRSTATALSRASYDFASVSNPEFAIFFENAGITDKYDASLTKTQLTSRSSYSNSNAAALAGNTYAITTGSSNAVEAYLIG